VITEVCRARRYAAKQQYCHIWPWSTSFYGCEYDT